MARRPKQLCNRPGCNGIVDNGVCYKCGPSRKPQQADTRPSAGARGYGARWRKARLLWLGQARNSLCVECLKDEVTEAATVVDHIVPHRGDMELFWDEDNWQSLCQMHHCKKTGRGE